MDKIADNSKKIKKDVKKEIGKQNAKNNARCVMMFVALYAITIGVECLKFLVLDKPADGTEWNRYFWVCFASQTMLMASFASYVFVARRVLIDNLKQLAVIMATVTIAYLLNVLIATFSYYYLFLALTAFTLVTLSDRKDVIVANIFTALQTFVLLYFNALSLGRSTSDHIVLISMTVIDIFFGMLASGLLAVNYRRTVFILMGTLLQTLAFGIVFVVSTAVVWDELSTDLILTGVCTYAPVFLALMLQPIYESVFGILSNSKLNELIDHSAPLIKRLIDEAPGTFNHCQAVASYAETCAIAIGENPNLAKACAYYHDIGKLGNPKYFSENQGATNLHDGLLPEVSAEIIRKHTTDGYELCKANRIPAEICEVTVQHHGTLPMAVFYYKAKNLTDSDVDEYDYCYHGQTPVGKIAAILMICDAAEAAIRSKGKISSEEVEKMVGNIIADRIAKKQFDNCTITLKDLNVIKNTIVDIYGGHVHKRVKYPSGS